MTTTIERYLNSLPENILTLDIIGKGIEFLPDLTRFKNLRKLNCHNNKLTSLSNLPQSLEILYCTSNQLTSLSNLPQSLKELYCYSNKLTSLSNLPENLEILDCTNNQLTSLYNLPQSLKKLDCHKNQLTLLPTLPQNLKILNCVNNPFYGIVSGNTLIKTKQNIRTLNNFRHLYYHLRFKTHFRKWLWEKVREPNIKKLYNPIYLVENLKEEDDLDTFLDNWK
jgi:Leucine-rich repeat (LRR) protein